MKVLASSLFLAVALALPARADISLSSGTYTQNFDSIGTLLPDGVSVRTGATSSFLGTDSSAAFNTDGINPKPWDSNNSGFHNYAAIDTLPFVDANNPSSGVQQNWSDRALGVHLKGDVSSQSSLGLDPGAAFTFRIVDVNTSSLDFTFSSQLLHDHNLTLPNNWDVRWGAGATPTSFTSVGTFSQNIVGAIDRSFTISGYTPGDSGGLWVQVVAQASGGIGNNDSRHTFAIDDLRITAVPEPSSVALLGITGLGFGLVRRFRRGRRNLPRA
ncbi:PEP-CTERM sorting domain-containing protein [Pirellulaceae bacterium SH467]